MLATIGKWLGGGVLESLFGMVKDHFEAKRVTKQIRQQAEIELETKKHEMRMQLTTADVNWDRIMAEGSQNSWKDEAWTIFLMGFVILHYIPSMQPYLEAGTLALNQAPDFIQYGVYAALAAAFGRSEILKWKKGVQGQ